MKKLIILGVALLALSLTPSSLISSNVMAQAEESSANVCLYEGAQYSLGAYVRVELSNTQYLVIRCLEVEGSDVPQWSNRTPKDLATILHTTE